METILGIDLGTTNSEVAVLGSDGRPTVLREDGEAILPSAVGLDREGNLLVGAPARNQGLLAPERTVHSIKRRMGTDTTVPLGERSYTPQEISGMILRELKQRAERALGETVERTVITVPAYFREAQRQATLEAGRLAGLEVVRILNEPTAAALTYDPQPEGAERVLVYDLGGGTFDVSIVQLEKEVVEVLASHGDTELGGDDMDRELFELVNERFEAENGIGLDADPAARSRVLRAVEEAKKALSFEPAARVQQEFVAERDQGPVNLDIEVLRDEYEARIDPLLERTGKAVDRALADAGLRAGDLDRVILVGGATRTPAVRALLETKLGQTPHGEVEPDLCVALGAATQAGLIAGRDVGRVLVDITPHTLGIEAAETRGLELVEHVFSPIIKKNTALPAARTEMYQTMTPDQEGARISVYQGEDPDTRNNTLIGECTLEGLSEEEAGERIPVRFELDLDGILTVTARDEATGRTEELRIESAMKRFREAEHAEAAERVRQALPAASERSEPALAEDADGTGAADGKLTERADRELAKAEQLLEAADLPEEDASELREARDAVKRAHNGGDPEALAAALPELEDLVFYLEDR